VERPGPPYAALASHLRRSIATPLARLADPRYTRTVTTDPATAFDAMAASYDELEPWYEHLYAILHDLLRGSLVPLSAHGLRALDAGCGTGLQTAILLELGYEVVGLDPSAGLLALARHRHPAARFARGDAQALPWRDGTFDVVVSCGSVLSFVPRPGRAIGEMARVLRPGGQLFLEVEHRWSLDLVWRVASSVVGDPLRYGIPPCEARRALARPFRDGLWIDYPGYPRLRLFTRAELDRLLGEAGLVVVRAWGLHSVTNVIPSTVLHRARLGRSTGALYRGLRALDRAVAATGLGRCLANSLVILAARTPDAPHVPADPEHGARRRRDRAVHRAQRTWSVFTPRLRRSVETATLARNFAREGLAWISVSGARRCS
jgi:MPBQ/MSBQ methyltransferase